MGGPSINVLCTPLFKKALFGVVSTLLTFSLFVPSAHAGFFHSIVKFFSGQHTEPKDKGISSAAAVSMPLLGSEKSPAGRLEGIGGPPEDLTPLPATGGSALIAPRNPLGTIAHPYRDNIAVYTVGPGDTPGAIAENHGISLNTLLWANNINNPNLIKIGDELVILPVTGVRYEVKRGDTLASLAKQFKAEEADIINFNGLVVGEPLAIGEVVIIPDGEIAPPPGATLSIRNFSSLPEVSGYFLRPILGGRKSRGMHGYNAVDLAQYCGAPVLASADGGVIIARYSGWNGGYGQYLVINHPNGTQTLYAHLSAIYASVGQYLSQGSQIGTVGSTGNSTGCHVHFEMRGARNPF